MSMKTRPQESRVVPRWRTADSRFPQFLQTRLKQGTKKNILEDT